MTRSRSRVATLVAAVVMLAACVGDDIDADVEDADNGASGPSGIA